MKTLIVLASTLLLSFSASAFEMGDYHDKNYDDFHGCWVQVLPDATSIKADGSCYTLDGVSYNILELVRMNYGTYEYTFEMGEELFVNKIVVSKELLTFKIYNVETGVLMRDEFLKKIDDKRVQYFLAYADYQGTPDVRFDVILDKVE